MSDTGFREVVGPSFGPDAIQVRAHRRFGGRNVEFYLFTKTHNCKPVELVPVEEGGEFREPGPLCRLGANEAQELVDDLWAAGIRPTEANGTAGSMQAVQTHLKDLQRLLFDDERTRGAK